MEKVNETGRVDSFTFAVPESSIGEKHAYFIVLTGGPKGGKTTSQGPIIEALRKEGFSIISFGESATEFINNNYNPNVINTEGKKVGGYAFQEGITTSQILKEAMARRTVNHLLETSDRVAVVYDRAVPDGLAYVDEDTFNKIISSVGNYTLEDYLATYDFIVHFVSTAKDKLEIFKQTQKEQERIEGSIKETVDLEDATSRIYPDDKKVVLWNDCTYPEKLAKAIQAVLGHVKKDARTVRVTKKNTPLLNLVERETTTPGLDGEDRYILRDKGHVYIMGVYQDGSNAITLEMMKGAPVPSWVIDKEEIVKEDPRYLTRGSGPKRPDGTKE